MKRLLSKTSGLLFIITGASGVGKGTIYKELLQSNLNLHKSISATTRKPRQGEQDGVEYYFVTQEEFENSIKQNQYLEYARVYDNYYGTPKNPILDNLSQNKDTLLEIDLDGARQIKLQFPQAIWIFIVPPCRQTLKERLQNRNTDSQETIQLRLSKFDQEMEQGQAADYIIKNDNLQQCVDQLKSVIIDSRRV